jgi:cytochrome c oxidase subunit 2
MNDLGESFRIMPVAASSVANDVDFLYLFTMGASIFVSGLVATLIVVFCVRYRRGSKHANLPRSDGDMRVELAFLALLLALFMGMFVWATRVYARLVVPQEPVERIDVVGQQWMWKMQYANGRRSIDELTVPVGRAMQLVMSSQDVIHSFYVPAFRIKQDVLPFRYTRIWFKATKVGTYHLFCAEYCGLDHARMGGVVRVVPVADYVRWLGEPVASSGDEGRALFEKMACSSCHDPSRRIGPDLHGVFGQVVMLQDGTSVTADEDYVRRSILEPQAQVVSGFAPVMPSFAGRLDETQLRTLIEYVRQLQGDIRAQP